MRGILVNAGEVAARESSYFWARQAKIAPKLRILKESLIINFKLMFSRGILLASLLVLLTVSTSFRPIIPGEYGVKTVVIDAGHGGKDPGAIGDQKMREKDVVLSIALKTGAYIQKTHPDVKVVYTRDKDIFIPLNERARIANKVNADLFISIHADAAANHAAYGTETFALGLHRSKDNLETAKRENAVILMEDDYEVTYEGFDPNSDESYVALSLLQSANLAQSLSIADKVQTKFTSLGRKDRGVKQAGFLVLYKTTMPAVLIENGFITNKEEGTFLRSQANQEKMAKAISSAFMDYKKEIEDQLNILRGVATPKPVATESPKEEPKQLEPEKVEVKPAKKAEKPSVNKPAEKKVKTPDLGVRFKVQIASSNNSIEVLAENFKGLEGVEELKVGEVYKYTFGSERNFEEGLKLQRKVKGDHYSDAFLIAVYKGERISISKALELTSKELEK